MANFNLVSIAALMLVAMHLTGCTSPNDEEPVCGTGLYCCGQDADCIQNWVCTITTRGSMCNPRSAPSCEDKDEDGFLFGPNCTVEPLDCDDADDMVFPTQTELCNMVDDNCSGQVDDITEPCPLQAGVCLGTMAECVGGEFADCETSGAYGGDYQNVAQADELCDGLDNNCSGDYEDGAGTAEIDPQCE